MIARVRKSIEEKDEGFTLIELLVVIIIIGILAAIAIPVFLNQRKKGVDASLKSDLRTAANELETYFTDNQAYPAAASNGSPGAALTVGTNSVKVSNGDTIGWVLNAAGDAYCIKSSNTGKSSHDWVYISNAGGLQPGATTACPSSF